MPSREFHLQLVLSMLENETYRASALFYPELSYYGTSTRSIKKVLVKHARQTLEELPLERVASRQASGNPEIRQVRISVNPPSRQPAWREPVVLRIPAVCWEHGKMGVAYVPDFNIEVVAKSSRDLDRLLRLEIQFALRRRGLAQTLPDLMWNQRCEETRVVTAAFSANIKTPKQLASTEKEQAKKPVLREIASSMSTQNQDEVFGMEDVVLQLAERLTARRPRSLLLVGPSGVGKTAAVQALAALRNEVDLGGKRSAAGSGRRPVDRCGRATRRLPQFGDHHDLEPGNRVD